MECPRRNCNKVIYVYGDRMLYCKCGSQRMWRHDAHVRLFSSDLSKAARHPVLEPRQSNSDRERLEIRALGSLGGTSFFDVTFTSPLTPSRSSHGNRVVNALSFLKEAWRTKMWKYRDLLTHSGPSHELIPVPICTFGGWHPDAHRAVMSVATVIATRAMISFEIPRQFLFQRQAAQLGAGNANCLMQEWTLEV